MSDIPTSSEFPDWHYAVKVFKRQWLSAVMITVGACMVSIWFLMSVKNVYRSTIAAIVDTREMGLDTYSGKVWAETAQRNFNLKFSSPEFLHRIVKEGQIVESSPPFRWFQWDSGAGGNSDAANDQNNETKKQALVRQMMSAIAASNITGDGTLTLTVDWDSAAEAQRIAIHAMDIWIISEFEDELEQNKRRLESLIAITASLSEPRTAKRKEGGSDVPTGADYNKLMQKLETAQKELHGIEDQMAYSMSQLRLHRVNLEVDLDRMRARFTSDHPEMQSVAEELKALLKKPATDPALTALLQQKRDEILALRIKLHLVNEDNQANEFDGLSTSQAKEKLRQNIEILEAQIIHPELRTRFHIIKTATFDSKPIKKRRSSFAMLSLLLSGLLGVVFAVYRELSNPLARDAWRVRFHSGIPVWGQIAKGTLANFREIDEKMADRLRHELGKDGSEGGATRALLGYRQIEVAVRRRCVGRAILLVECSTRGNLRDFFSSLFNIFSTDIAGRILVIDCNHVTTLRRESGPQSGVGGSFPEMLKRFTEDAAGDWRSMIEAANPQCPYDFIGTSIPPSGYLTRIYREVVLKPLMDVLLQTYDFILIRGLPETHFLENSALASSSSDTLMVVDSLSTTIAEVTRSTRQLGSDSVRAMILVGT